jgi:hypothetical protein
VSDDELRDLLFTLSPSAREHLRAVLIRDHADCDAIASMLMRHRDQNGQDGADSLDSKPKTATHGMNDSGVVRFSIPDTRS